MDFRKWPYRGSVKGSALSRLNTDLKQALHDPRFKRYFEALEELKSLKINKQTPQYKDGVVHLLPKTIWTKEEKTTLKKIIKAMLPWRKGPFKIGDLTIDAEWRSDLKWERLKKQVGSLQGRVILDIGCNNGYFMFPMALQNPRYILGIDPVVPYYQQFQFLNSFSSLNNMDMRLFGLEHLNHFESTFDVVFCMGILYHHTDPIGILRNILNSMRPGGLLIVEAQGIAGNEPLCLLPQKKYCGMPGHWFLPTQSALINMLSRAGFQYIECFEAVELDSEEQRATELSPHNSLQEGLENGKTIEGYPAPWRFYLKARKGRKGRHR